MKRILLCLAACAALGCGTDFQQVEIAAPAHARVVILEGVRTPEIGSTTPFVGNFEAVSLGDWAAYDLRFDLDAKEAARYGANGPLTIYGRLVVGEPTEISKRLTLMLRMPDDMIADLVQGRRVDPEIHVDDPNPGTPRRLVQLTLRMTPFS